MCNIADPPLRSPARDSRVNVGTLFNYRKQVRKRTKAFNVRDK